jgi:IS30 family transposase
MDAPPPPSHHPILENYLSPEQLASRLDPLLSLSEIARLLGRNVSSIYRALKRLKIEPTVTIRGAGARYCPSVLKTLEEKMRRPNYSKFCTPSEEERWRDASEPPFGWPNIW